MCSVGFSVNLFGIYYEHCVEDGDNTRFHARSSDHAKRPHFQVLHRGIQCF